MLREDMYNEMCEGEEGSHPASGSTRHYCCTLTALGDNQRGQGGDKNTLKGVFSEANV